MKIINLIHIGDEVRNLEEMSPEEKREVAYRLNAQALKPLGYAPVRTEMEKENK